MTTDCDYKTRLKTGGVIVLEGVAGTGKTYAINECAKYLEEACPKKINEILGSIDPEKKTLDELSGELAEANCPAKVHKHVMHPSTSYEEFIGGLRPTEVGASPFTWQQGAFLKFLDAAIACPCTPHLFVMDEINRCNLASVIGELMYLIEPSRRVKYSDRPASVEEAKKLMQECNAIEIGPEKHDRNLDHEDFENIYWIPDNFYILGTMNSSDRSIIGFDQALRRRFPPYRIEPFNYGFREHLLELKRKGNFPKPFFRSPRRAFREFLALNTMLRFLIGPDAMIGHSYLLDAFKSSSTVGELQQRLESAWQFGILPQVIHACETVRRNEYAEILCGKPFLKPDEEVQNLLEKLMLPDDDISLKGRWRESVEATGARLSDKLADGAKEALNNLHIQKKTKKLTRQHYIQSVGDGHGARLLITPIPTS